MPPLEPSAVSDDPVDIEQLRKRISVLESSLDWALNRLGVFEPAAAERLETIRAGAQLIASLQAQLSDLQHRHDEFAAASAERLTVINHGAQLIADLQVQLAEANRATEECREALHRAGEAAASQTGLLNQSQQLLHQRDTAIGELSQQLANQQARHESLLARIQQLEGDTAELRRGSLELAARERILTAENLELRNEGLLHSIIRRARTLFS